MKRIVKLFAQASDLAGASEIEVQLDSGSNVAELRSALQVACPELSPIVSGLFVAIDSDYASETDPIPEQAEIACFPPVSGG